MLTVVSIFAIIFSLILSEVVVAITAYRAEKKVKIS